MLTLHHNPIKERRPRAIVATFKVPNGEPNFSEDDLPGEWWRVFPISGSDVRYLQSLEHRVDKFAPATGGGVLVHPRALTVKES